MTQSRLFLPGCHLGRGSRSRTGRSIQIVDDVPPVPSPSIPIRRGAVRKPDKKKSKTGKRVVGSASAILNFSSRPTANPAPPRTDRERVNHLLRRYRELVLQFEQEGKSWPARQAFNAMNQRHRHLLGKNTEDREGHIPGVEVGDIFYSRYELFLVGLHKRLQAGIASKEIVDEHGQRLDIAVSVVSSGGYEDDDDRGGTLRYTGVGGNDPKTKRQIEHQQMTGGNLALLHSKRRKVPVRVCRGRPSKIPGVKTEFSYDGLYRVKDSEKTEGKSKFIIYTFDLKREANQLPL